MQIPTIKTPRLLLFPPTVKCFSAYENFYTDSQASKMYGGPISSSQAWARLKMDLGLWPLVGFCVLAIKYEGKFVGTCGYW